MASVYDAYDPSFRLCEACLLRWDVEQSHLPGAVAEAGVRAYVQAAPTTTGGWASLDIERTLKAISKILNARDRVDSTFAKIEAKR